MCIYLSLSLYIGIFAYGYSNQMSYFLVKDFDKFWLYSFLYNNKFKMQEDISKFSLWAFALLAKFFLSYSNQNNAVMLD
jgi:hypothetical protein